MLQDGLLTAVYPPVGLRIGVVSLGHMCPNIPPGVDRFLGLFLLHQQSYIQLVRVWCQILTTGRLKLACLLFLCMSTRFSRLRVSGGRLRPGLSFQ